MYRELAGRYARNLKPDGAEKMAWNETENANGNG